MIKVNVGMSRKVSKDYNSTGFSINLEGEIALSLDDPELAVERIRQFYDLAEESLAQQIERYESISAIASHDEPLPMDRQDRSHQLNPESRSPNRHIGTSSNSSRPAVSSPSSGTRNQEAPVSQSPSEAATNKQIQFLATLGKRNGLSQKQLEDLAAHEFGPIEGVYHLSKQQAGALITMLNQPKESMASRR